MTEETDSQNAIEVFAKEMETQGADISKLTQYVEKIMEKWAKR